MLFSQVFKDMKRDSVEIGVVGKWGARMRSSHRHGRAAGCASGVRGAGALAMSPFSRVFSDNDSNEDDEDERKRREDEWKLSCDRVDRDPDSAFGVLTQRLLELDVFRHKGSSNSSKDVGALGGMASDDDGRGCLREYEWPALEQEQALTLAHKVLVSAGTRTQCSGDANAVLNILLSPICAPNVPEGAHLVPDVTADHDVPIKIKVKHRSRRRGRSGSVSSAGAGSAAQSSDGGGLNNSDSEGGRDGSDVSGESGIIEVEVDSVNWFEICDGNRVCIARVKTTFKQAFYMADESVASVMGPSTVSFEFSGGDDVDRVEADR